MTRNSTLTQELDIQRAHRTERLASAGRVYTMTALLSPQPQHLQLPVSMPAPSRTASTSSVRSAATSADDLAEVMRIDSLRAPYDRRSVTDVMSRVKLDDANAEGSNGTPVTSVRLPTNGHAYSPSKSPSASQIALSKGHNANGKAGPANSPVASRRRFPEEEDEDILRETEDRFVLFPIKYREVSSSGLV